MLYTHLNKLNEQKSSGYRWYILTLSALTNSFGYAVPTMCMPVLFKEISQDIGLSLVEMGALWGIISFAGIFVGMIGGLLGDRFGVKRTLSVLCILAGVTGALRGFSNDFITLSATMFLFGLMITCITPNSHKVAGIWFPSNKLGFANSILSTGMAAGYTLASMISATWLSPLIGGWRNVLFLYGAITVVIGLLWLFTGREPKKTDMAAHKVEMVPLRQALSRVVRMPAVWLLGITLLGYFACVQGAIGYLPLYLRNSGWPAASADGALAAFNGIAMLTAIPLATLSDRIGLRKPILYVLMILTAVSFGLLAITTNSLVWPLIILAGTRDGLMAIGISLLFESPGVGALYAGTAFGMVLNIERVGSFGGPPIGNSLAGINAGLPFAFWAALCFAGIIAFYFVKETGWKHKAKAAKETAKA